MKSISHDRRQILNLENRVNYLREALMKIHKATPHKAIKDEIENVLIEDARMEACL